MSRTYHNGERRIRVRGVKKDPPDLRRLARALIEFTQAEQEAAAKAIHDTEEGIARAKEPIEKSTKTNKTKIVTGTNNVKKKATTNTTPEYPRKGAA